MGNVDIGFFVANDMFPIIALPNRQIGCATMVVDLFGNGRLKPAHNRPNGLGWGLPFGWVIGQGFCGGSGYDEDAVQVVGHDNPFAQLNRRP